MRKLILTMAGLAALATTSVAVAHGIEGAKTAKAVAGTFSASAGTITTRTCTTTDGKSISVTDGKYTGVAGGDADLAGPITLRTRSVINTTDKVGIVRGAFRIDVSGRDTTGAFVTVFDNGAIAGLATARARNPGARIVGNLSATFDPSTGFTGGARHRCVPADASRAQRGSRSDLGTLHDVDHSRRAQLPVARRPVGGHQREVQDGRPGRDPVRLCERSEHADPHRETPLGKGVRHVPRVRRLGACVGTSASSTTSRRRLRMTRCTQPRFSSSAR